jgi:hypothetical protein
MASAAKQSPAVTPARLKPNRPGFSITLESCDLSPADEAFFMRVGISPPNQEIATLLRACDANGAVTGDFIQGGSAAAPRANSQ